MALFAFVSQREGIAAPSAELAAVLSLEPDEQLLGRRLRGIGMWDLGRELFEIVIPARLPADLDYTADAHLGDVLDFQARGLPFGESYVGLRERLRAYETVVLQRYVESPGGEDVREPVALLVFFPASWPDRAASRLWRYAHSWATRRPRPQHRRRVDQPEPLEAVSADDRPPVVIDPTVMAGAPCIRGTRTPVVTVLGALAAPADTNTSSTPPRSPTSSRTSSPRPPACPAASSAWSSTAVTESMWSDWSAWPRCSVCR